MPRPCLVIGEGDTSRTGAGIRHSQDIQKPGKGGLVWMARKGEIEDDLRLQLHQAVDRARNLVIRDDKIHFAIHAAQSLNDGKVVCGASTSCLRCPDLRRDIRVDDTGYGKVD